MKIGTSQNSRLDVVRRMLSGGDGVKLLTLTDTRGVLECEFQPSSKRKVEGNEIRLRARC
jgi:hypothetical protein